TSGPNSAPRDNVAHNQTLYTILETPPPVIPLCRKQARTYAVRWSMLVRVPRVLAQSCRRRTSTSPALKNNAGEIALLGPDSDSAKAEAYFKRALAIARSQQAKILGTACGDEYYCAAVDRSGQTD